MKQPVQVTLGMLALLFSLQALAGDAKHYPGVFVGMTNVDGETDLTLGVEYEYKLSKTIGFGGVVERTPDGHGGDGVDIWVASLFYHPSKEYRFGIGYGEERIGGTKVKYKDVVRLSAVYEYHMESVTIAPTLAVDFIDGEEAYVIGAAFLFPF